MWWCDGAYLYQYCKQLKSECDNYGTTEEICHRYANGCEYCNCGC